MQPTELQVGSIKGHKTTPQPLHVIQIYFQKKTNIYSLSQKFAGDDPLHSLPEQ